MEAALATHHGAVGARKPGQWPGKARIMALLLEQRAAKLLAAALQRDAHVDFLRE